MENQHSISQARLASLANKNFFDEMAQDLQSSPSSGENQRLNVTLKLFAGRRTWALYSSQSPVQPTYIIPTLQREYLIEQKKIAGEERDAK